VASEEGSPQLDRLDLRDQGVEQVAVHGGVSDHPLHGDADLAGVDVPAGSDRVRRCLDVRVRQDHDRARGAQLERQLLHPGGACDVLPDRGGPGERDLADPWVADQGVAEFAAGPGQHVQDARRQPGVGEGTGQGQRGERGGPGRFEHHGVPGGQRGCDLVQHQQRGVVERRDRDHHAARLAQREADLVLAGSAVGVQRQGVPVELGALVSGEPDHVTGPADLAARLGDGLAVLGGQQGGDGLDPLLHDRGRLDQHVQPGVRRGLPPHRRAAFGGYHCRADVVHVRHRDLPDHPAVIGGTDLFGPLARTRDPVAADQDQALGHRVPTFLLTE
jgi:hypothetical protein